MEIKEKFKELYNMPPDTVIRSPARINLIGEHTDYNGGFVLPAAIDKEIHFALAANYTDQITIYSQHYNESVSLDLLNIKPSKTVWLNYILGVIDQLQKAGYTIKGFDCAFGGNIPLGAGLSSSAAITCGLAYAINELFQLNITSQALIQYAQQAEHTFAGVQCGIMDQFANVMGRAQYAIKLDCRSLEYEYIPLDFGRYSIILCDSKVKHSLADSAYNTRKEECIKGLGIIKAHFNKVKSLRDVTLDMLKKLLPQLGEVVFNRCRYIIEENERVLDACRCLEKGDIIGFGENLYGSHYGMSLQYNISCKELDFLIGQTIEKPYVAGARMMGGGFGGCSINIVESEKVQLFIEEMTSDYMQEFGIEPAFYQVKIAEGTGAITKVPQS